MTTVTLEGTQELMKHRDVAVILATGGMGLVRAAYSAGKPAYGVGPGNAPCYIERSADLKKAASDIMIGKTFDNGVLCSSPNSVVVDEAVAEEVAPAIPGARRLFHERGRDGCAGEGARHAPAAPEPRAGRKAGLIHRRQSRDQRPGGYDVLDRATGRRRPRLSALDREAVPGAVLVCRQGLARRV